MLKNIQVKLILFIFFIFEINFNAYILFNPTEPKIHHVIDIEIINEIVNTSLFYTKSSKSRV